MAGPSLSWLKGLGALRRRDDGVASVEFAFLALFLVTAVLNVADIAMYAFKRMEVQDAADLAAMQARHACNSQSLPATVNCSGLNAAITAGIQGTQLGSTVTLKSGSLSEGYYCLNTSYSLVYVSGTGSKPTSCSSVGQSTLTPGDYVTFTATYNYQPLVPKITVASLFSTPLTATAWIRLG